MSLQQSPRSSSSTRFIDRLPSVINKLPELFPKLRCFLLSCDGELLAEHYANGSSSSTLHDLRSATKSFIGALYGIAQAKQEIAGLHEPLAPHFTDMMPRRFRKDTLWQQITPYRLLTMTTGFHWKTGPKLGERYIHAFHRSPSWTRFALRLPIQADDYGQFQYRSIDSHLLSMLITRCTGQTADQYAAAHLFKPLQIQSYEWLQSPDGDAAGHIGLMLTGRDMLRFGEVMTHGGLWPPVPSKHTGMQAASIAESHSHSHLPHKEHALDVTQVLPTQWVNDSMTAHSSGYPGFGTYGYQRWNDTLLEHSCSYALGHGGQVIYSIPKLKLSIAMASDPLVRRWRHPKSFIEKELLPALLPLLQQKEIEGVYS